MDHKNWFKNYKYIIAGILLGVFYWLFDSSMDALMFHVHEEELETIDHFLFPAAHEIWMRFSAFVLLVLFGVFFQRLTNKSKIVERERDQFFNLSRDLFCIASADGYFINVNPAFEEVLGYSTRELLTKPIFAFIHPDDRQATHKKIQRQVAGQSTIHFENRCIGKSANIVWLEWNAIAFEDSGLLYAVARDITERKKIEEEIKNINTELEKQVLARTEELQAFSYSLSHDLRTPLRAIHGFTEIFLSENLDKLDENGKAHLVRVQKASQYMSELLDKTKEILDIIKKEVRYKAVNLSQKVEEILLDFHSQFPDRKVKWCVEEDIIVNGDEKLLSIMLENLISNAWKFTSTKSDAVIEFGKVELNNESRYFIKDNGVGFDMNYSEKLFQNFQRLHSPEEYSGFGIGLAIVRKILRTHNGNIWAESSIGEGATFYFTLDT